MLEDHDLEFLARVWALSMDPAVLASATHDIQDWIWVKNGMNFLPLEAERLGIRPGRTMHREPRSMSSVVKYGLRDDHIVYGIQGEGARGLETVFGIIDKWKTRRTYRAGQLLSLQLVEDTSQPQRSIQLASPRPNSRNQLEERYFYEHERLMRIERDGSIDERSSRMIIDDWYEVTYTDDAQLKRIEHRGTQATEVVFSQR